MYSFSRRPTEKSLYSSQDKGETSRKEQCVLFGPFSSVLCTDFALRKRVEFNSKDSMSRRPTEKSLYSSQDKGETSRKEQCVLFGPFSSVLCTDFALRKRVEFDLKDSMTVDSHSSRSRSAKTQEKSQKEPCVLFGPFTSVFCTYLTSRNRVKVDSKAVDSHSSRSRSAKTQSGKGKNAARLPTQSSAAEKSHERVVVKAEPIHSAESIRSPSPIVISSEESNPATPKGKEPIRDNRRVSR